VDIYTVHQTTLDYRVGLYAYRVSSQCGLQHNVSYTDQTYDTSWVRWLDASDCHRVLVG